MRSETLPMSSLASALSAVMGSYGYRLWFASTSKAGRQKIREW